MDEPQDVQIMIEQLTHENQQLRDLNDRLVARLNQIRRGRNAEAGDEAFRASVEEVANNRVARNAEAFRRYIRAAEAQQGQAIQELQALGIQNEQLTNENRVLRQLIEQMHANEVAYHEREAERAAQQPVGSKPHVAVQARAGARYAMQYGRIDAGFRQSTELIGPHHQAKAPFKWEFGIFIGPQEQQGFGAYLGTRFDLNHGMVGFEGSYVGGRHFRKAEGNLALFGTDHGRFTAEVVAEDAGLGITKIAGKVKQGEIAVGPGAVYEHNAATFNVTSPMFAVGLKRQAKSKQVHKKQMTKARKARV